MLNINLRNIFCYLTNNENFLSQVIETEIEDTAHVKQSQKKKFNLMANMVIEYIPLAPYDKQDYAMLPTRIKNILSPNYVRWGIKNVVEKDMEIINISFLNSLNMLLRPELLKANIDEQTRNFYQLEAFICFMIKKNFQIDKTKNTQKVQAINREMINNLIEGKISHELIQTIVNIFEINLLVFDLTKMESHFYWAKGYKYPFLNPFRDIYCMTYIQGNYEPIMTENNTITEEEKNKIYLEILTNITDIKCMSELQLSTYTIIYLETWKIDLDSYIKIIERFYPYKRKFIGPQVKLK